jgi:hypothetical protein
MNVFIYFKEKFEERSNGFDENEVSEGVTGVFLTKGLD